MLLQTIDIVIIVGFMALILIVGLIVSRRASRDTDSLFLGSQQAMMARHSGRRFAAA
jgi:hypothetical protein